MVRLIVDIVRRHRLLVLTKKDIGRQKKSRVEAKKKREVKQETGLKDAAKQMNGRVIEHFACQAENPQPSRSRLTADS